MALPAGYAIRKATTVECTALPEIERAASKLFVGHPGLGNSTIDLDETISASFLRSCAREGTLWVATHDDVPVAFAACEWRETDFFLVELDVHPDHGRNGLGRALVEVISAHGFAEGADRIALGTFLNVPWNRPFYESAGFSVIPEDDWTDWMHESIAAQVEHGLDRAERCFMERRQQL